MTKTPATLPAQLSNAVYRKISLRLLPLLFIGLLIAYIDRLNVSYAKLAMQSDLALSDAVYGAAAGLFFLGAILFEVPSSLFLHKVGPRLWLFRIMITWGAVTVAMMFVTNEAAFYALRFLLGVAEAGFIPGVILYLTYWFPPQRRATVNTIFLLSVPLAGVVGGPLAALFLEPLNGFAGLHGWQWLFLVEGLMAVGMSFVLLAFLTPTPDRARWLTSEEKAHVAADLDAAGSDEHTHSLRRAMRDRRIVHLALIYAFMVFGAQGLTYWAPQLITNSGVGSPGLAAVLSAIPFLVYIPVALLVTRSSDRTGDRKWHMLVALSVSAVGWLITVGFAGVTPVAIAGMTLANVGGVAGVIILGLPASIAGGAALAGAIALVHALGNVGAALSPSVFGALYQATGSTATSVLLLATGTVVAAVLVIVLPRELAGDRSSTPGTGTHRTGDLRPS